MLSFDATEHRYTINGKPSLSVTQLIHLLCEDFDSDYWAEIKAKKYGKEKDEVLKEWNLKNKLASAKGHILHNMIECKLSDRPFHLHDFKYSLVLENLIRIIEPQIDLVVNYIKKYYDSIELEHQVYSEDFLLAGTIDFRGRNKITLQKDMFDWKTNSELSLKSTFKLKDPLFYLDSSDLTLYSLQLNFYEILSKDTYNKKIIHFSELNSKPMIYNCHKLNKECLYILDNIEKFKH